MEDEHPDVPVFEYTQITENIFLGTNLCCQTHFSEELLKKQITIDVSLEGEQIDSPYGVEYFAWIPVKDTYPPSQDQFDFGVSVLEHVVATQKKAYVHCKYGHGRAPSLVAAYLISTGKTAEEAVSFIKEKRPVIHPMERQIDALVEFEKRVQK